MMCVFVIGLCTLDLVVMYAFYFANQTWSAGTPTKHGHQEVLTWSSEVLAQ